MKFRDDFYKFPKFYPGTQFVSNTIYQDKESFDELFSFKNSTKRGYLKEKNLKYQLRVESKYNEKGRLVYSNRLFCNDVIEIEYKEFRINKISTNEEVVYLFNEYGYLVQITHYHVSDGDTVFKFVLNRSNQIVGVNDLEIQDLNGFINLYDNEFNQYEVKKMQYNPERCTIEFIDFDGLRNVLKVDKYNRVIERFVEGQYEQKTTYTSKFKFDSLTYKDGCLLSSFSSYTRESANCILIKNDFKDGSGCQFRSYLEIINYS